MTSTITPSSGDAAVATRRPVPFGAGLAAAGLVLGAGGNAAQAVLAQLIDRPSELADQIVLFNERPVVATAMCVVGLVAVPFMAVGFLAAARFLRGRAPRTGTAAAVLLVLGMWGFLAVQTAELIQLTAMLDPAGSGAATYLHGLDGQPLLAVLFGVPFMAGTVLGMLLLGIGLLVTGAVPRWIPTTWIAFIVLDFSIGAVGPVDPHWLYFAGAVGLAVHLLRDRGRAWANA